MATLKPICGTSLLFKHVYLNLNYVFILLFKAERTLSTILNIDTLRCHLEFSYCNFKIIKSLAMSAENQVIKIMQWSKLGQHTYNEAPHKMADCKSSKMITKKTYFPSLLVFFVKDNEPSCCEKTVAQIIAEQCKKEYIYN